MLPENIADEYRQREAWAYEMSKYINKISSKINREVISFPGLPIDEAEITGPDVIFLIELIRMDTRVSIYLNYKHKVLTMMTSSMYDSSEILSYEKLPPEEFVSILPTNGKIMWNHLEIKLILKALNSLLEKTD